MVMRVCVTGAAGQIGYALLPHICSGRTFGPSTKIILHLLDIPRAQQVSADVGRTRLRRKGGWEKGGVILSSGLRIHEIWWRWDDKFKVTK